MFPGKFSRGLGRFPGKVLVAGWREGCARSAKNFEVFECNSTAEIRLRCYWFGGIAPEARKSTVVSIRILLGQNREHPTTFPGMFSGELSRFPGYPGKSPNIPVFPDSSGVAPYVCVCFSLTQQHTHQTNTHITLLFNTEYPVSEEYHIASLPNRQKPTPNSRVCNPCRSMCCFVVTPTKITHFLAAEIEIRCLCP